MAFTTEGNELVAHYTFSNFSEALAFLVRVGLLAEQQQHHPHISNVYNQVTLRLSTHDAGHVVTEKDHRLARAIEELLPN